MSRCSCGGRHAFQGQRALVTGANGGLGRALVEALLGRGVCKVYAASRSGEAFPHPRVVPLQLDITDAQSVAQARAAAPDVTLLLNNAGVNASLPLLGAADMAAARAEIETNYLGTLAMCRAFAPLMRAQGGGTIANVLSAAARLALPGMGSLCASKAAALHMTQCLRAELKGSGVSVVAFLPGALDTRMSSHLAIRKASVTDAAATLLDGLCEGLDEILFPVAANDTGPVRQAVTATGTAAA